jgi:endonuclease YncB( thermonuclease family)
MGGTAIKPGRIAAVATVAAATVGIGVGAGSPARPAGATAAVVDKDCDDFSSQKEAQEFFESHDPAEDPHGLDADGDGEACETLPCPCADDGGGGGGGGGNGGGGGGQKPDLTKPATVVEVTDGDTIAVRTKGRERDVRLIGIDTPEVFFGAECGGAEASASMSDLLSPGAKVTLVRDRSQDNVDDFGRLLRYVERGKRDVGHTQIARGWAEVFVFESPFRRRRSYREAEDFAEAGDRGVWGMCGGDFHKPLVAGPPVLRAPTCKAGERFFVKVTKGPVSCANAKRALGRFMENVYGSAPPCYPGQCRGESPPGWDCRLINTQLIEEPGPTARCERERDGATGILVFKGESART